MPIGKRWMRDYNNPFFAVIFQEQISHNLGLSVKKIMREL